MVLFRVFFSLTYLKNSLGFTLQLEAMWSSCNFLLILISLFVSRRILEEEEEEEEEEHRIIVRKILIGYQIANEHYETKLDHKKKKKWRGLAHLYSAR